MSSVAVTSATPLDAVLRTGVRRILARRPPIAVFDFDAACDASVSAGQAARILCVLREAILNSIDYSHPTGIQGSILLSSTLLPDGRIGLEVADDGIGLPEGFDPAHDGGDGFRIMRRVSAELGADLSVNSTGLGLTVSLIVPVSLPKAGAA